MLRQLSPKILSTPCMGVATSRSINRTMMVSSIRQCSTTPPAAPPTLSDEMPRLRSKDPKPSVEEDKKEFGWLYAELDSSGKTAIDRMYDGHHESVMRSLLAPIAPTQEDGCVRPDFAVGLQQYHHSLRGAYREAIAKALQVAPQQVRLSVAWSARYDVKSFFKGVRKVLGVTLVSLNDPSRRLLGSPSGNDGIGNKPEICNTDDAFDSWRQRISGFARTVQSLNRSDLVALHIIQATSVVNEVNDDKTDGTTLSMDGNSTQWQLPDNIDKQVFTDALVEATMCLREALRIYAAVIVYDDNFKYPVGVSNPSFIADQYGVRQSTLDFVIPSWKHQLQKCHITPAIINLENLAESFNRLHIGYDPSKKMKLFDLAKGIKVPATRKYVTSLLHSKIVYEATNGKVGVVEEKNGPTAHVPLIFINGAFVGGVSEMAYLSNNSKSFKTMVLHPDDIEIKSHLLRKVTGARTSLVTRAEHINMTH